MMKIAVLSLVFLIFFPKVIICKGMTNREEVMNDENLVIIKKQDDGKEIAIKRGDIIQIELEGMGSAGYRWYIENIDYELLELIKEETVTLKEGVMGAPILNIWRIKALKKGHTEIKIDHYREWEGREKATDSFSLRVNIQ